jgi:hypothetical protein
VDENKARDILMDRAIMRIIRPKSKGAVIGMREIIRAKIKEEVIEDNIYR